MISKSDMRNMLTDELGLAGLSQNMQDEIIEKFGRNVLQKVTLAVLEALPEEKRTEFEAVSAGGDAAKTAEFLNANVPDMDALVSREAKKELEEFKKFRDSLQ